MSGDRAAPPVRLILLDIEGTTAPIAFVRDTLFPYAARTLPDFVRTHADSPDVASALAATRDIAPDRDPVGQLLDWIARDEKIAPLKTLQGLVWREGFARGELRAQLYPDVVPVLHAWKAAGYRLAVYSSGSAASQRLLYGHTDQGDLTGLFSAFHDLAMGSKKEAASYRVIAAAEGLAPGEILFLSDIAAELHAARDAGCRICQIVRPQDGTIVDPTLPHVADLAACDAHLEALSAA